MFGNSVCTYNESLDLVAMDVCLCVCMQLGGYNVKMGITTGCHSGFFTGVGTAIVSQSTSKIHTTLMHMTM